MNSVNSFTVTMPASDGFRIGLVILWRSFVAFVRRERGITFEWDNGE